MLAQRIKELRKASNMTQEDLALKVGAKRKQAVSNWEKGSAIPTLTSAVKLAEIFGVSLDYLVGKENNLLVNVSSLPNELAEIVRNTAKQLESYSNKKD